MMLFMANADPELLASPSELLASSNGAQARKLLLRGYTVKALVRGKDEEVKASLPRAVQLVYGDVGDPLQCKEALKGCNKVRRYKLAE
jgi:hypothetical protein